MEITNFSPLNTQNIQFHYSNEPLSKFSPHIQNM